MNWFKKRKVKENSKYITGSYFNNNLNPQNHILLIVSDKNGRPNSKYSFRFKNGLNAKRNGLIRFTLQTNLPHLIDITPNPTLFRIAEIPDDALIIRDKNDVYMTNKIILGNKKKLINLEIWRNKEKCLKILEQYPRLLRFIRKQNYKLCKQAVIRDGLCLKYVKIKNKKIDEYAIMNNPSAIRYANNPSDGLCELAIVTDPFVIQYIKNPSTKIKKLAIEKNPLVLKFIKKKNQELCMLAVSKNADVLKDLEQEYQTPEVIFMAIMNFPKSINYIKNKNDMILFEQSTILNKACINYIKDPRIRCRCQYNLISNIA